MRRKVLRPKQLSVVGLLTLSALTFQLQAQVTIGSGVEPDENALLDLKEGTEDGEEMSKKGLLLPRVKLISTADADPMYSHVRGMFVYNTDTTTGANSVVPGVYYNDGEKWIKVGEGTEWYIAGTANDALNDKAGDISRNGRVSIYRGENGATSSAMPNSAFNIINETADDANDNLTVRTYSGDAAVPTPALYLYHTRGTQAAPLSLNKGENIGSVQFGTTAGRVSGINAKYQGDDGSPTASDLTFQTSGSTQMTLDSSGNLGIGTSAPVARLDINASSTPMAGFRLNDGTPDDSGKVLIADANGVGTWQYYGRRVVEGSRLTTDTTWIKIQGNGFTYTGLNIEVPPGKSIVKIGQIIRNKTNYNGYVAFMVSTTTYVVTLGSSISHFPRFASYNMGALSVSTDQVEFDVTNTSLLPVRIYIWSAVNGLGGVNNSYVPDMDAINASNAFGVINAAGENFIAVYY